MSIYVWDVEEQQRRLENQLRREFREEGLQEGLREGRERGEELGKAKEMVETIGRLCGKNHSLAAALELIGKSEDEYQKAKILIENTKES